MKEFVDHISPMRAGEALGLDIRSIHEDFRTLEIVQKAKRGELQDHMKTKNADSRHGRVVDLSDPLAAMLRDFVGGRTSGLVFCKPDDSQLMQRNILKHSLHPILKKLELEQGGCNILRRFRITELETAEVPAALQHTWSGHAKSHVSEVYKKLLKQRDWRLRWQKKQERGSRCQVTRRQRRRFQMASLARFWNSVKLVKSGGREGIRTPGLLVANEEKSKLRLGATVT
jgi:hypothetical protein